ncbi:MAG: DMT family transporter [Bacteroidia bacterium]
MKEEDKILRWFYLAVLAIIWGSSFILMKRGLVSFSPDQVAAIRMFVSFIALLPFVIKHMKKVKKEHYKWIFLSGILGNGIPAFLFTHAQTHVVSAVAGMLNSLTPVFVVIIGTVLFGSRFRFSHIAGVIIGLAGAVTLILIHSSGHLRNENNWYGMLIIFATICYAFSVNIIRKYLLSVEALFIAGFALFAAGIPCGIFLFTTDFTTRFTTQPEAWESFGYIVTLALFGTAFSTVMFYKLVKISNALYASSVTYLIPIVAMLWGVFDNEGLGWYHIMAMAGILLGVYLINLESIREMKAKKVYPVNSGA